MRLTNANSAASINAMNGYFRLIWAPGSGARPGPLYASCTACQQLARACDDYAAQIGTTQQKIESSLTRWLGAGYLLPEDGVPVPVVLRAVFANVSSGTPTIGTSAMVLAALISDDAAENNSINAVLAELTGAVARLTSALGKLAALLDAATAAAPDMALVEAETVPEQAAIEKAAGGKPAFAEIRPPGEPAGTGS